MGTLIRIDGMAIIISLFISINSFATTGGDTISKDPINNHSGNSQYERLQNALQRLYEIQKQGGWPKIIATQKFYLKGQTAPAIKQIKERLRISGDFNSKDTTAVFTDE